MFLFKVTKSKNRVTKNRLTENSLTRNRLKHICWVVQETPFFLSSMWKIPYVYCAQTLLFIFQISCEILVARSSPKFAYFFKESTSCYHFVKERNLRSDMALNIQGAIWTLVPIYSKKSYSWYYNTERIRTKRPYKIAKECEVRKRSQKNEKPGYTTFSVNFAFFCVLFGKRDTRTILD